MVVIHTYTHRDIANYFLSLWLDTHFLHTATTVMEQSWYAWSAATACSCFMLQVKSKYDVTNWFVSKIQIQTKIMSLVSADKPLLHEIISKHCMFFGMIHQL